MYLSSKFNFCSKPLDRSKIYWLYDLGPQERLHYLNIWRKVKYSETGKPYLINQYITLKKVDADTKSFLYGRTYNPVTISHLNYPEYPYKAQIWSIDDSQYGIWFKQLDMFRLMDWISNQKVLNGGEFITQCIDFGADPSTVDYN